MSVTYTAVLAVRDETADFLAALLTAERRRPGTRGDTRSLSCRDQAVLVLRWFLDGTRMRQLARDNAIGKSTSYDYLHEGYEGEAHPRSACERNCSQHLSHRPLDDRADLIVALGDVEEVDRAVIERLG